MKNKVEREVFRLEERMKSAEAIQRMSLRVTFETLTKAEQLRKLALALVKSKWQHRCKDRVGGCTAVSDSKLGDLEEFLKGTMAFRKPLPARDMRKVRAFITKGSK